MDPIVIGVLLALIAGFILLVIQDWINPQIVAANPIKAGVQL